MTVPEAQEPFVDPAGLVAFWETRYLVDYVAQGGSVVKWLNGREGSGKTYLLRATERAARDAGFLTARTSAREVNLGRFDELYRCMMSQLPRREVATALARAGAARVGGHAWDPSEGGSLKAFLLGQGRPHLAVEEDVARCLDFLYTDPSMEPPVATALRRLALPLVSGPDEALALAAEDAWLWLTGGKIRATARRRAGIHLTLDRYSARDVLRSFLRALQLAGRPGVVWTIDDLEAVVAPTAPAMPPAEPAYGVIPVPATVKYTRMRRMDAYESIRELIDEGGRLPGFFVVYAGRPEVFSDEKAGLVTYAALAMRVQEEVVTDSPNLFNDVQDLDLLWNTDWSTYQTALVQAYGQGQTSQALVSRLGWELGVGTVSPVKRLVTLLGESRQDPADSDDASERDAATSDLQDGSSEVARDTHFITPPWEVHPDA